MTSLSSSNLRVNTSLATYNTDLNTPTNLLQNKAENKPNSNFIHFPPISPLRSVSDMNNSNIHINNNIRNIHGFTDFTKTHNTHNSSNNNNMLLLQADLGMQCGIVYVYSLYAGIHETIPIHIHFFLTCIPLVYP